MLPRALEIIHSIGRPASPSLCHLSVMETDEKRTSGSLGLGCIRAGRLLRMGQRMLTSSGPIYFIPGKSGFSIHHQLGGVCTPVNLDTFTQSSRRLVTSL